MEGKFFSLIKNNTMTKLLRPVTKCKNGVDSELSPTPQNLPKEARMEWTMES